MNRLTNVRNLISQIPQIRNLVSFLSLHTKSFQNVTCIFYLFFTMRSLPQIELCKSVDMTVGRNKLHVHKSNCSEKFKLQNYSGCFVVKEELVRLLCINQITLWHMFYPEIITTLPAPTLTWLNLYNTCSIKCFLSNCFATH